MTFSTLGASTLQAEVTNIDRFGFWLLVNDKEYFLPYEDFPWFRQAKVDQIGMARHVLRRIVVSRVPARLDGRQLKDRGGWPRRRGSHVPLPLAISPSMLSRQICDQVSRRSRRALSSASVRKPDSVMTVSRAFTSAVGAWST